MGHFVYYIDGVPQPVAVLIQDCKTADTMDSPGTICEVQMTTLFPTGAGDVMNIMVKSPVGKSASYSCRLKIDSDMTC